MAMGSAGGGGKQRRRGRRSRNELVSEINVTPMVDVMLVLLIVFMVAAPLMTVGVPLDLPKTQAREMNTDSQPVTISVTPEGAVFIDQDPVPMDQLVARVTELVPEPDVQRLYLRGDTTAAYGSVMEVMGLLSGAGFSKIGLITEQAQAQ